jgi:predicted RND superfamily exporter protein
MKRIILIFSLLTLSLLAFGEELKVNRTVEESVTKDYNQNGVYSSYKKALRRAQKSVYVKLPETKRVPIYNTGQNKSRRRGTDV